MLKKHHTPRYIISRLKQKLFEITNPDAPWLTAESIGLLDQLIRKIDIGVEFGSGRSTKWLASRCHQLISIESNLQWFETVSDNLKDFSNVRYLLKGVDGKNPFKSEYLDIFKEISENTIDFILNDGKVRDYISQISVDKLRSGGLLIIDNAERYLCNNYELPESIGRNPKNMTKEWANFENTISGWRRIWTTNGVSSTLMLFKP